VTTYEYRLRSPIGGLAADLAAELRSSSQAPESGVQIDHRLWLELPGAGLHWRDLAWLSFGVSLNAAALSERYPAGTVVRILRLDFPLAFYRAEVASLAVHGWLRQELGLPGTGVRAEYSDADGAYRFHWGTDRDPFADA
jgi:hypothetical protein